MATNRVTNKDKNLSGNSTGVSSARAAKAGSPRVTTVKHSKPQPADAPIVSSADLNLVAAVVENVKKPIVVSAVSPSEAIAKIAYGYWESRNYQGGNAEQDWLLAESEYYRNF